MSEHAKLSPSGAVRWISCPGSPALESAYPDKSSDFAEEGTLAHAVAAHCLEMKIPAGVCSNFPYTDHGVEKRAVVSADMAREVQKYLDHVRADLEEGDELFVEQRLPIFAGNAAGVPEQFGTSDTVVIKTAKRQLRIRDLKYGRGVQVFAERNPQLMLYALGALDEFGLLYDFDEVVLIIDQPRLDHVDEWTCTVEELRAFEQFALRAGERALMLTEQPEAIGKYDDTLVPGDKQCQFCKAKGNCPALRDKVVSTVAGFFEDLNQVDTNTATLQDVLALGKGEIAISIGEAERIIAAAHGVAPKAVDFSTNTEYQSESGVYKEHPVFIVKKPTIRPALDEPEGRIGQLDDDHLAICMDSVDLVEGWCKAVRAEVERRMLAGTLVPGWKLVQGKQGNRCWADPAEAEKLLKSFRLKNDVMFDWSLISPTTAEKLAAAGTIKPRQYDKLQDLISRSNGKPSVAPASDKRPALDIGKVEDEFEDLGNGEPYENNDLI